MWIHAACDAGANIIFTPEHTPYFPNQSNPNSMRQALEGKERILAEFSRLAKERKVWINLGMDELDCEGKRFFNKSYLINEKGEICSDYAKIHLFNFSNGKEAHVESKIYRAGEKVVLSQTPWGKLGLSICYDVRFPMQYRKLRKEGADFFSVLSAFTQTTGKDHWHLLLQARAIENSCYVFAPNQCGMHLSKWNTYGHSLIISPWGKILADGGEKPGFILASVCKIEIEAAREKIPSSYFD